MISAEREHALLSASSSHRWLACTPSVRLEEQFEEKPSEFAEEGTLAHSICELKLRKKFLEPMGPSTFTRRMNKLKAQELYQEEMQGYTDKYIDYISEIVYGLPSPPTVAIEKKVDYSEYAPEGFGTSDCSIVYGNTLHIIDFKYGKGIPVSAEDNPQMKLYALGALKDYAMIYGIETVHITIVQPRLDSISLSIFELVLANNVLSNFLSILLMISMYLFYTFAYNFYLKKQNEQ
ncbi:MAG: DUF2800 domain-containing protein [Oscillospiraceae bacterium]